MKYFVTGEKNVGKTYLVEKIKPLVNVKGFETRFEPEGQRLFLHFLNGLSFMIGERNSGRLRIIEECFKEAARELGTMEIPESCFLIMDEIGYLEEESPEFQQAVVAAIRRSKNCICVLRKGNYSFIDHLKRSMGIRSVELTVDNRDEILNRLLREVEKERTNTSSPGGDEGI